MNYLTAEQILLIHSMLIDEYGGSHGIRIKELLLSTIDLPQQAAFGKELYPTPFLKAAVYARNIIASHPFIDGNKRTGITSGVVFLENNGLIFTAGPGEIEDYAVYIANKKPSLEDIAAWLKERCAPLKKTNRKNGRKR